MSTVGQKEIMVRIQVFQSFRTRLDYDYLDHWQDRIGNNVERDLLRGWLRRESHNENIGHIRAVVCLDAREEQGP